MAGVLKRAEASQDDRESEVNVRPRGVDTELDPQRTTKPELFLKTTLWKEVDGIARQVRDAQTAPTPVM